MTSPTEPSPATEQAEEEEATAAHQADRAPTAEEDQAAPTSAAPGVAEHEKEMDERGANVKGEGQLP